MDWASKMRKESRNALYLQSCYPMNTSLNVLYITLIGYNLAYV